jgi:hypothetical protein
MTTVRECRRSPSNSYSHTGQGLIKQEELRFPHKRTSDEHPLLLTTGEPPYLLSAGIQHSHTFKRLLGGDRIRGSVAPEQSSQRIAAHQDHVPDAGRKVAVEDGSLGDVADRSPAVRGRLTQDLHDATVRGYQTQYDLQQGALSAAIRPDDAQEVVTQHCQIDALKRRDISVANPHVPQFDNPVFHHVNHTTCRIASAMERMLGM